MNVDDDCPGLTRSRVRGKLIIIVIIVDWYFGALVGPWPCKTKTWQCAELGMGIHSNFHSGICFEGGGGGIRGWEYQGWKSYITGPNLTWKQVIKTLKRPSKHTLCESQIVSRFYLGTAYNRQAYTMSSIIYSNFLNVGPTYVAHIFVHLLSSMKWNEMKWVLVFS